MSDEIRKCPCCDNDAITVKQYAFGISYRVMCQSCKISTTWYSTKKLARDSWNTRTAEEAASSRIKELEEALEKIARLPGKTLRYTEDYSYIAKQALHKDGGAHV